MNRIQNRYQTWNPAIRNQKVFTKTDFIKSRLVLKLLPLILLLSILGLFWTWSRVQILQMSVETNRLLSEQRELKELQKSYLLELAVMQNPTHLEKVATTSLGMSLPKPEQILNAR